MSSDIPDNSPLKSGLTKAMEISVVVKENGDFWLVHDRPFAEEPSYVEYEPGAKKLTLMTDMGNMYPVDLELPPRAYERLMNAQSVFLIYMEGQTTLTNITELPVLVQHH